jgi:hypothetical protein
VTNRRNITMEESALTQKLGILIGIYLATVFEGKGLPHDSLRISIRAIYSHPDLPLESLKSILKLY